MALHTRKLRVNFQKIKFACFHRFVKTHRCPTYQLHRPPKTRFGNPKKRTVPYIQGSALQSGFLPKSDVSNTCIRKCMLLHIIIGDFGLPSLLFCQILVGSLIVMRNPECTEHFLKPFLGKCRKTPGNSGFRVPRKRPIQGIQEILGNSFWGPQTGILGWFSLADENGQSWYVGHGGVKTILPKDPLFRPWMEWMDSSTAPCSATTMPWATIWSGKCKVLMFLRVWSF